MKLPNCRQLLLAIAALTAVTFSPSAEAQNLIINGGFEDGFSSYTLSMGNFSFAGNDPLFAHSGNGFANLESTNSIGTLSQTFNTMIGQTYSISFFLANDSGVPPNSFAAFFNGTQQFSISNSPVTGYTNISFNAVATTTSSTLQFQFRHDDDFFRLDDISVVAVPEPSTNLLMLLSGVGIVGVVHYRRTQRQRVSV